ncbi:MAG: HlyC/CorC family transporter [Lachnospiraceae bacterium]|nr:HlyC/CorC family transporter [Lachnospiraceae bacterium]
MDPNVILSITLFLLIIMSALFSCAETTFMTVNRIKVLAMVEDGNKKAELVIKILDNQPKMLSAVLIGNNLVNISASAIATTLAINLIGNEAVSIATGLLTFIVLIFGEITPKNIATVHANKLALVYAPFINALMWILTPVIFIINKLAFVVLLLFKINPNNKSNSYTEEEIRTIVSVSHEEGVIESQEKEIIENIFDFGDSLAKDIMIPRIDMTFINIDSSYHDIIETFKSEKYTRFPVYKDSTDNVVGIINVKDLLLYDNPDTFSVKDILREPYFTYEFKKTSDLMDELRKTTNNITIVLDEYGMAVGMITLEDLLEEIVGEIRDEYDYDEEEDIQQLSENEYIIDGNTKLDDINEAFDLSIDSKEYDSIAGLVIETLDKIPENGDEMDIENLHFTVTSVDKNRIEKVKLIINPIEDNSEDTED